MKKFIIEVIIFSVVLIVILQIMKWSLPYYWANPVINNKVEFLEDNTDKFDGYFVGSSKTYRHIDPKIIKRKTGLQTFNLGSPGTFALETEYITDHFTRDHYKKDSTIIFIQSNALKEIAKVNRHSVRTNYYIDTKRLFRASKYFFNKNNYRQMSYHLSAYIENQLCIGMLLDMYQYKFGETNTISPKVVAQNGFYPLDQDLKENKSESLTSRNAGFMNKYSKGKVGQSLGKKNHNINVEKKNVSELTGFDGNYKLYKIRGKLNMNAEYYFDKSHYNSKGAKEFSNIAGQKLNKFLKK